MKKYLIITLCLISGVIILLKCIDGVRIYNGQNGNITQIMKMISGNKYNGEELIIDKVDIDNCSLFINGNLL